MAKKTNNLLEIQLRARTDDDYERLHSELTRRGYGFKRSPLYAVQREDNGSYYYFTTAGGIEWRDNPWLFDTVEDAKMVMDMIVNGWNECRKWVDPENLHVTNMPVPRPSISVVKVNVTVVETMVLVEGID